MILSRMALPMSVDGKASAWPAAILVAGLLICGQASADDCKPLTLLNSVPLVPVDGDPRFSVTVTVNTAPKQFLFDTGGYVTQLSYSTAVAMGLPETFSRMLLSGANGVATNMKTHLQEFGIGRLKSYRLGVPITFALGDESKLDGLLSSDFLEPYDIDVDFGGRRLNFFAADHCPGPIYWHAPVVAVVPISTRDRHINVPVTLDGHPLNAIIDTGAALSVMGTGTAEQTMGLPPAAAADSSAAAKDTKPPPATHVFSTLSFEGVAVNNLRVTLLPQILPQIVTASSVKLKTKGPVEAVPQDEIILGMNVLQHLHLYIAYKDSKLFITPADDGAAGFLPPMK
jgi:Aspartyl protease